MPCPGPLHLYYSVDYIYDFCPLLDPYVGLSIFTSKEPLCPRVELILKIIIILLIIFLGFIKSKPC